MWRVMLISDSCPASAAYSQWYWTQQNVGDPNVYTIETSQVQAFRLSTSTTVYVHCSVKLCLVDDSSCKLYKQVNFFSEMFGITQLTNESASLKGSFRLRAAPLRSRPRLQYIFHLCCAALHPTVLRGATTRSRAQYEWSLTSGSLKTLARVTTSSFHLPEGRLKSLEYWLTLMIFDAFAVRN